MDTDDYIKGMRDCRDGKEHKQGMSEDYDKGYAAQYQHEQNMTEMTRETR